MLRQRHRELSFNDLSRYAEPPAAARSEVLQFYSSVPNIGNYLPVRAIHGMIGGEPDVWCMHRLEIDFDWVNKHYRCIIIGGAGLLHKIFEPFWTLLAKKCRLPIVIWGVGGCSPKGGEPPVEPRLVRTLADRIDLVNVRDEWTAEHYDFGDVSVTPCPCVIDVRARYRKRVSAGKILFACHTGLTNRDEAGHILDILRSCRTRVRYTDNIQREGMGVDDIIMHYYCESSLVVTSRLHGAIISYALGIPYIGVDRDAKISEFARMYGNGVAANIDEICRHLAPGRVQTNTPVESGQILAFAERVRYWLRAHKALVRSSLSMLVDSIGK